MRNFMREYGTIIMLVGLVTAGIYLYKAYKQTALEYSLEMIGDRLLTLLPEGESRQKIASLYEEFKEQALARQLSAGQVEQVAANVLNFDGGEANVSSDEVETMIRLALAPPAVDLKETPGAPKPPPVPKGDSPNWSANDLESLGEKLKTMCDFDRNYRQMIAANAVDEAPPAPPFRYVVDNGLRLDIDVRVRDRLHEPELQRLAGDLRKLEQRQLLSWKENLTQQAQERLIHTQHELERLVQEELVKAGGQVHSNSGAVAVMGRATARLDSLRAVLEKVEKKIEKRKVVVTPQPN